MANFLPMNGSPFGQMNLYTPDWSFLTTVMGTKQAEYDRGFNAVKSSIDKYMTANLTNEHNSQFRDIAFEKLKNGIKSISNLDLSQGANVNKALTMIDPITQDKELMYDFAYTSHMDNERQKMESYRNSTDPKIRSQYNDYAKLNLDFADLNMKEAVRGTGEILKVQPENFVPFENPAEYLNTQMKNAGIKIKQSTIDPSGYIIETTNGPMAAPIFKQWAASQMGNRFDEQYNVIGKVQTQMAIRNTMETGYNRQDATKIVTDKMSDVLIQNELEKEIQYNKAYAESVVKISLLQQEFPVGGVPESKAAIYQAALDEKRVIEEELEKTIAEKIKLQDPEYLASNLNYYFGSLAKEGSVDEWATSTALATTEETIKADDLYIAKMKEAGANSRHAATLAQSDKHFILKLAETQAAANAKLKPLGNGTTDLGTVIGTFETTAIINDASILNSNEKQHLTDLKELITDNINGPLALLSQTSNINNATMNNHIATLNKMYAYANGDTSSKFSAEEVNSLVKDYNLQVDYLKSVSNPADAKGYMLQLMGAIGEAYNTSFKKLSGTPVLQNQYFSNVSHLKNSMNNLVGNLEEQYAFYDSPAVIGLQNNASYRELLPGIRTGYTPSGNPMYNFQALPEDKMGYLNTIIPDDLAKGGSAVTPIYNNTVTDGILYNKILSNDIMVQNNGYNITGDFDNGDLEIFQNMSADQLLTASGGKIQVATDIANQNMELSFNVTTGKGEDIKNGKIKVKVPFQDVRSDVYLKSSLYPYLKDVGQDHPTISGEYRKLLTPGYTFTRNSGNGMKTEIFQSTNPNNPGFMVNMTVDYNGQSYKQSLFKSLPVTEQGILELQSFVDEIEYKYSDGKALEAQNTYNSEKLIPYTQFK